MRRYLTAAMAALALAAAPGFGGGERLFAQVGGVDSALVRQMIGQQLGSGLTPADVLERIRNSGLSSSQIRQGLEQAGYDPALANQYMDLLESGGRLPQDSLPADFLQALQRAGVQVGGAATDSLDPQAAMRDQMRRDSLRADSAVRIEVAEDRDSIYGHRLFVRPTTRFEPALLGPVPPDYRLGPGDAIQLVLTGDVELAYRLVVSRQGSIIIPQVGQISVNGLTLEQLEDRLYDRLGQAFSGVRRGPEATTRFQVSLGELRTNQVYVIGEVERPDAYQVSAMATAFTALYRAMGPTDIGSFRDVQIRRNGEVVAHVDLYDYLLSGDSRSDIRLEHGDIVFVPVAGPRVRVGGAVRRPMIYEMAPDEGLRDLVRFAGGFRADALVERVQIDRVLRPDERSPGIDRVYHDVDLQALSDTAGQPILLRDGDRVEVFAVNEERRRRVSLHGAVERESTYEWTEGLTLAELLERAGGLEETAYRARAHIYRLDSPDGDRRLLRTALIDGGDSPTVSDGDVLLADRDSVVVFDQAELRTPRMVAIEGFVKEPGLYPLAPGMSPKDLILAAGGFADGANMVEVEVARRPDPLERGVSTAEVIRLSLSDLPLGTPGANGEAPAPDAANGAVSAYARRVAGDLGIGVPNWLPRADEFELAHGDQVFVRKAPGYEPPRNVVITGQVNLPGRYTLQRRDERLTDVLERAGGFSPEAHPAGLRLIRDEHLLATEAEAAIADPESYYNLALEAGDSIHVPAYSPTVLVRGEVTFETLVPYEPGAGLDHYIEQAGGYTDVSDKSRVTVTYQNGARESVDKFLFFRRSPRPTAGSTIMVPSKPASERGGFDWDTFLTRTLSLASTTITVLLAAERLRN